MAKKKAPKPKTSIPKPKASAKMTPKMAKPKKYTPC